MGKGSRLQTTILAAGIGLAGVCLAVNSISAQSLVEFDFDEGSGPTVKSKAGDLVGTMGVPSNPDDDPAIVTDSASLTQDRRAFVATLGILDQSSTAFIPNDSKWHHVAVVHEFQKEFCFFVNGTLGATVPYTRGVIFTRTNIAKVLR